MDTPLAYTDEENASIEALPILGYQHIDIAEHSDIRRQKNCPRDIVIKKDRVCVEPAVGLLA